MIRARLPPSPALRIVGRVRNATGTSFEGAAWFGAEAAGGHPVIFHSYAWGGYLTWHGWPDCRNWIDDLVNRKLATLRLPPSGPCTDAEFVRRAFLDAAGILPTPAFWLALYCAVESRMRVAAPKPSPLFWYVSVSLGVPLAGRVLSGGTPGFAAHAAWVLGIALFLTLVMVLPSLLRNRIHLRT